MNKVVKTIVLKAEQRASFWLHKITFADGYVGLEKNDDGLNSAFREGEEAEIAIFSPGKPGKPDWITRVFNPDKPQQPQPQTQPASLNGAQTRLALSPKDIVFIADRGLCNAIAYIGSTESDPEKIINMGYKLAMATISNSEKILSELTKPKHL